jgi:lysophospholipase L1-like esterase
MAKIGFAVFILFLALCTEVSACPLIGGQVDYNCDQMHKVVVIGDSVVRGIGDLANGNQGGYVLRLQKKFKKSVFVNMGKPGYSTERIFSELKSKLAKHNKNSTKEALKDADLIFIDAGRNDYFEETPPGTTVKTLERIVALLREDFQNREETVPVIKIATLLPTTRAYQRSFIGDVNNLLIEMNSDAIPVRLYFNLLDESIISVDGIHPYSNGYAVIAKYVTAVLKGGLKEECESARLDDDKDGIYDIFEKSKFGTNPEKTDTDGDGFSDGEEVFNLLTDPLTVNE